MWQHIEAALPPGPASSAPVARGWRLGALGATAAALVLAAMLTWQVLKPGPAVLVVLLDDAGEAVAVLEAYADNRVRVTPLLGGAAPGLSQDLELWTKPDPDGPPISVGVLQRAAQAVVQNSDLPPPSPGQLYEITLEPEGGSPTGLPTGPVFGIGNARQPILDED
jgi:anti-sigma-K factor RskA